VARGFAAFAALVSGIHVMRRELAEQMIAV